MAVIALHPDILTETFPIFGNERYSLIDGDTFWRVRMKSRIVDIDAPELSPPRCEAEPAKGEDARFLLQKVLNSGAFSLAGT